VSELPELEHEIAASMAVLQESRGRAIASISVKDQEKERNRWLDWAEAQLKVSQRLLDAVEEYPELAEPRARLGEVAHDFVAFHGYAHEGRTELMLSALRRVQENGRMARQSACRE